MISGYKNRRKKNKGFWRLITSVAVLAVIWQLIFFQCLTPLFYSKAIAEDNTPVAIDENEPGDQQENNDGAKEEESTANEQGDEEEEAAEETGEIQNESNDETGTQEQNESPENISGTGNPDEECNDSQVNGLLNSDLNEIIPENQPQDFSDPAKLNEEGVLKDNEIGNNCECNDDNDAKPEDDTDEADENLGEDKDSCLCPETAIENTNDTSASNTVESTSDTGNNAISENEISDPLSPPSGEENDLNGNRENIEGNSQPEECEDIADPVQESQCDGILPLEEKNNSEAEENNGEPAPEETDTAIDTGESIAAANVYNDVNSNVISDNGERLMTVLDGEYTGDINLLENFLAILGKASPETIAYLGSLEINNENKAEIMNILTAMANSGNNSINGSGNSEENSSQINTGDAVAVANAVNYVNQNIIGSNWIFSAITVFGTWIGDLIVPGEGLLTVPVARNYTDTQISNVNETEVENTADSAADTGGNTINGSGEIETGDAFSGTNVVNLINTNIIRNNWFFLLINNMGFWIGDIFNWNEKNNSYQYAFSYDFQSSGECEIPGSLSINNQNSAAIKNSVSSSANSGNNSIDGNGKINTGNAYALSNIFNFINSNFIGDNWMFGIVNIMGTWKGNLIFAYPDLALSLNESRDPISPGDELIYTVTYKNEGKARSDDTAVMLSLPQYLSYQGDTSGSNPDANGNDYTWKLSGLKPGEEKSFQISTVLDENVAENVKGLESAAGVKTDTKEVNLSNNYASVSTSVYFPPSSSQVTVIDGNAGINGNADQIHFDSGLEIKRASDATGPVHVGTLINNYILVTNSEKSTVYNIIIKDKIKDTSGVSIIEYTWQIDELEKGEKALVQYQEFFNPGAKLGQYEYTASASGQDPAGEAVKSKKFSSIITLLGAIASAASPIQEIVPPAQAAQTFGEVAGTQIEKFIPALPLWIFLAALAAYFLAINWSLVRKKIIPKK